MIVSRQGMIVAGQYANELPAFPSLAEAEKVLFAQRDAGLREMLSAVGGLVELDYSPESLKHLERWYFEHGSPETTTSGYSVAHAVAFYFGEVLCWHAGFTWVVQEFAFAKGRFELGVRRPALGIMLTKGKRLQRANNKRMQSLWREFSTYAP